MGSEIESSLQQILGKEVFVGREDRHESLEMLGKGVISLGSDGKYTLSLIYEIDPNDITAIRGPESEHPRVTLHRGYRI